MLNSDILRKEPPMDYFFDFSKLDHLNESIITYDDYIATSNIYFPLIIRNSNNVEKVINNNGTPTRSV